ncbi:MAG: PP2C family protein-serine/threonine phosphatase [Bryobacteraceae bacterium]
MSRVRPVLKRLGVSGVVTVIGAALLLIFYFSGHALLAICDFLILIPFILTLTVRGVIALKRNALWSVRNRLLLTYGLFGVLPMLLLFIFFGLGSWALMNELAIYLASSALDRRLDAINAAAETLRRIPADQRDNAAPQIQKAFSMSLPGMMVYLKDSKGTHRYPATAPALNISPDWKPLRGLLVYDSHFYGWSHYTDGELEINVVAPLTNQLIENLVPDLGEIALVETPEPGSPGHNLAAAGSLEAVQTGSARSKGNPDYRMSGSSGGHRVSRLPPAFGRLDIPVFIPSTRPHYHLDSPGKTFSGVLWVYSRPSAVMRSFFSGSEVIRDFLADSLIVVAVLFCLVELVAVWIGVSLSRRMTRAVNQLYEGTRRVIQGDFQHRIPVTDRDQLSELALSFNQMTGNLERLLSVEKEKERLQTELEIAREVQAQLYPKEAPPVCGLKLTVRCDPARMVSGDYYDYQQVARGKVAFAIGDVAGKGISAALLMATLQAALRAQITAYTPAQENECSNVPEVDAAALVSKLNKQIYAHTAPEKYATFFFALFNEETRVLTYTNAGHLSPLLFRGGEVIPLDSNGTVVGAFPFAKYDESCLTLNPGDLLVCYTDGITEPENAFGEMFGEERLIDMVQRSTHLDDGEIVNKVLESVRSWTGSPELHDDMTLLIARQVQSA